MATARKARWERTRASASSDLEAMTALKVSNQAGRYCAAGEEQGARVRGQLMYGLRNPRVCLVRPCELTPCQHGGTCLDLGSGSYSCQCPAQFDGPDCTECAAGHGGSDCSLGRKPIVF